MDILLYLNFAGLSNPEVVIILTLLIPFVLSLVDIVRSDFKDITTKLLWGLIVIFAPILGPLLYLAIGRGQKVLTR